MNDFLEFEETQKSIKSLNLDDFSVEDLNKYISELKNEISRVKEEIEKKSNLQSEAQKFFSKY
tara:strand:- start:1237 stop:1425 length:189 start_codon:yes stop_codon:yes gene_type:complete